MAGLSLLFFKQAQNGGMSGDDGTGIVTCSLVPKSPRPFLAGGMYGCDNGIVSAT